MVLHINGYMEPVLKIWFAVYLLYMVVYFVQQAPPMQSIHVDNRSLSIWHGEGQQARYESYNISLPFGYMSRQGSHAWSHFGILSRGPNQVLPMPTINQARSDTSVAWGLKNQYGSVLLSMALMHTMALRLVWDPGGQHKNFGKPQASKGIYHSLYGSTG